MAKESKKNVEAPAVAEASAPVAAPATSARVLSLRSGDIVTSKGTLVYRGTLELPIAEVNTLAQMFKGMIQIL